MEQVIEISQKLTATREQPTRGQQANTKTLAVLTKWFEIDICDDPQIASMVQAAGDYAKAIRDGKQPHWLVILGKSGNGKTHVCNRIWRWVVSKCLDGSQGSEYLPHRIYWPDFVDELKGGSAYGKFNDMKRWPYLFIDDAWANRTSDFSEDKLNTLLGCRAGKWTMITANSTMQAIAGRDVRIASRFLRDGCKLIDIRTTDYNRRNG